MNTKRLQIHQLEKRIEKFAQCQDYPNPPTGWIRAIRTALGMTLEQLANKLSITKQSVRETELREMEGSITLKNLRETANALDMDLVYGLVPKERSLEKHIEKKARKLARNIVHRTSNNMKLEGQENTKERIQMAIKEHTEELIKEIPKSLWD